MQLAHWKPWLWSKRDKRWVKEILTPEAQRSGIRFGTLLTILEDGGSLRSAEDELSLLRQLAPTIRAELASSGKADDEAAFSFDLSTRNEGDSRFLAN